MRSLRKESRNRSGTSMDAYITPLIALAGTLVVALIGLYQWRRQRHDSRNSASFEARRKAYENLWLKLEEINIKLREEASNPTLFRLLRGVNTFFLQNSLWFEDREQKLINDYVAALDRLRTAVYDEGDEEVVHAWLRTWFEVPKDVAEEIRVASDEVRGGPGILNTAIRWKPAS